MCIAEPVINTRGLFEDHHGKVIAAQLLGGSGDPVRASRSPNSATPVTGAPSDCSIAYLKLLAATAIRLRAVEEITIATPQFSRVDAGSDLLTVPIRRQEHCTHG